jgi:hypothetical protein
MSSVVYACRRFSKSVPLKRMASSQNFFVWFSGDLIFQRCLIPHRTKSCGVLDPAEQDPAGYQISRNSVLRGIRPAEQWQSCVHYIADTCSARHNTSQNNILWGLIPRLAKFCGVLYPAEQSPAGYQTPQNNI